LKIYIPVTVKFLFALAVASLWTGSCAMLSRPWIGELSALIPAPAAVFLVAAIALVPGFMYAFIVVSLVIDRRPPGKPLREYPPLTVLIAAFNEEERIRECVDSVIKQDYPGELEVIVVNDGSTDRTSDILKSLPYPQVRVIEAEHGGKANALNHGLQASSYDLVATLDADTFLYRHALQRIVGRLLADPPQTVAVAGAVLVRNSRVSMIARMQEWDYFHGIASVKRMQSLFQGTLVAQGAFSLFRKTAVLAAGGWLDKIGEDIVLTWALLKRGGRIGFAEDAVCFTNVPDTYRMFFRQRRRWSRGMIEGFKSHPRMLISPRLSTFFVYWNLLFPLLDSVFLFVFLPGLVAALFGYFPIAGPMTLAVLPLALLLNFVMFRVQRTMFAARGLAVRRNFSAFLLYSLAYQIVMVPACVAGYASEILSLRKQWGTKWMGARPAAEWLQKNGSLSR
jgi:biofilm PGA synthesis N-glycosyltransferase PgaC